MQKEWKKERRKKLVSLIPEYREKSEILNNSFWLCCKNSSKIFNQFYYLIVFNLLQNTDGQTNSM